MMNDDYIPIEEALLNLGVLAELKCEFKGDNLLGMLTMPETASKTSAKEGRKRGLKKIKMQGKEGKGTGAEQNNIQKDRKLRGGHFRENLRRCKGEIK